MYSTVLTVQFTNNIMLSTEIHYVKDQQVNCNNHIQCQNIHF